MKNQKEFSPQALGIATLEVIHRILDQLVERQLMTDEDVTGLFSEASEEQGLLDKPANQEASELLAWIAKDRARKFR